MFWQRHHEIVQDIEKYKIQCLDGIQTLSSFIHKVAGCDISMCVRLTDCVLSIMRENHLENK